MMIAAFRLPSSPPSSCCLFLIRGSVLDFGPPPEKNSNSNSNSNDDKKKEKEAEEETDKEDEKTPFEYAIVNAANEGCLHGGGVDGAINEAGGPALWKDRQALPILNLDERDRYSNDRFYPVRCWTGHAKLTRNHRQNSANNSACYGKLRVPSVIHAVGPNYHDFDDEEYPEADKLLKSAYWVSLWTAKANRIDAVAFSLLSAGLFRGKRSLKYTLRLGVRTILTFMKRQEQKPQPKEEVTKDKEKEEEKEKKEGSEEAKKETTSGAAGASSSPSFAVKEIYLYAFTQKEMNTLLDVLQDMEGFEEVEIAKEKREQFEAPKKPQSTSFKSTFKPVAEKNKQAEATKEKKQEDEEEEMNKKEKKTENNEAEGGTKKEEAEKGEKGEKGDDEGVDEKPAADEKMQPADEEMDEPMEGADEPDEKKLRR